MADNENQDKELAKALQIAKKKPRNFAIIAKGINVLKLMISKKPFKEAALLKAKQEHQGNVILKGVVHGEGPELVFEVIEEPTITETKFKKFITDTTWLSLKPRFQIVASLQEVDDDTPDDAIDASVGSTESNQTQPSQTPPTPMADQLMAALSKLTPAIKQAVIDHPDRKEELLQPVANFKAMLKSNDLVEAKRQLMLVGTLLKSLKSGTDSSSGNAPSDGSFVTFTQARLRWDLARKQAQSELAKLEDSILNTGELMQALPASKRTELAQCTKTLYTVMDKLDERLIDKLDEALNAKELTARAALNRQAAGIVKEYQTFVATDPLINNVDRNPFTPVNVRNYMDQTLAYLAKELDSLSQRLAAAV